MKEFLFTGGITGMSLILAIAIVNLIIFLTVIVRRLLKNEYSLLEKKLILSVKALGGIAVMMGVFYQTLGLYQAFQAIRMAADISPAIVMGGVFVSFYSTMFGMGVCLGSYILWYVLKMVFMDK